MQVLVVWIIGINQLEYKISRQMRKSDHNKSASCVYSTEIPIESPIPDNEKVVEIDGPCVKALCNHYIWRLLIAYCLLLIAYILYLICYILYLTLSGRARGLILTHLDKKDTVKLFSMIQNSPS